MTLLDKVLLTTVALVTLVLLPVTVIAAYAVDHLPVPTVEGAHLAWGEATSSTTTVHAEVALDNRLPSWLTAGVVDVDAAINFFDVEAASLTLADTDIPRGKSTVHLAASLQHADFILWWPRFVNEGEQLKIRIQPRARLLGVSISPSLPDLEMVVPIPIMLHLSSDKPLTLGFDGSSPLEILANPADHIKVSPPQPDRPLVTLESWELHWGEVSTDETEILGTLVVQNETSIPLPVQGIRLGLDMNEVSLTKMAMLTSTQTFLDGGERAFLSFNARVDNSRLVAWWASHLQHQENTRIRLSLGLTVALPSTSVFGLVFPLELALPLVPAFECDLTTDIMGVANYKIDEALGKAAGPEPEAARLTCVGQ